MSKVIFVIQLQSSPETLDQKEHMRIPGRKNKVNTCTEFNMAWILTGFGGFFAFVFSTLIIRRPKLKRLESDLNNVIRQDLQEILVTEESQGWVRNLEL